MPPINSVLRDSIASAVAGTQTAKITAAVEKLIATYRSDGPASTPILSSDVDVAAYALYRMPATYAAARAALQQVRLAVPNFQPRTLVDFGAGTGAVAWAATEVWPELTALTMLEQSDDAIALGSRMFEGSPVGPMQNASWLSWQLAKIPVPVSAHLATAAYLLGELAPDQQRVLVELLVTAAPSVVLIEPGTPAGFARIIQARDQLIERGLRVLAPCPHQFRCPMLDRGDWCHFAERLERSGLHRFVKAGELSYEDEKYSYVAASRTARVDDIERTSRVVRHPRQRKGLVSLQLCAADGGAVEEVVSKSQAAYKQARRSRWGDRWPPRADPQGRADGDPES